MIEVNLSISLLCETFLIMRLHRRCGRAANNATIDEFRRIMSGIGVSHLGGNDNAGMRQISESVIGLLLLLVEQSLHIFDEHPGEPTRTRRLTGDAFG